MSRFLSLFESYLVAGYFLANAIIVPELDLDIMILISDLFDEVIDSSFVLAD